MSVRPANDATALRATRRLSALVILGALAGPVACGSDSSTEPLLMLTPADQLEVAGRVAVPAAVTVGLLAPDLSSASLHGPTVAATATTGLASASARAISSASSVTIPVDRTVNCPAGGTARTTGTLTGSLQTNGSGTLSYLLFTSMAACGVTTDGRTLLLSADPGLEARGSYVVTNRVPADPQTLTISGKVNVSVSGSRAIALGCVVLLTVTTSPSTHVSTISGTVCGSAVSRQLTWSP